MRIPFRASFSRGWRMPKAFIGLVIAELPFTVAALALFGIADPDLYRTSLWQEGANHGWNSDPIEILYAYANYRPIKVPVPWNQFITNFNIIISVLSMFILLVKSVMYICETFPPILSIVVHALLSALYAVSIYNQAGSDYSDPQHPSKVPWYLTHSCGAPVNPSLKGYCMQAKGAFAVTVCLFTLFFTYFVLSIISAIPTSSHPLNKSPDLESPSFSFKGEKWEQEMHNLPQTPGMTSDVKNPMTPRTLAFNTLDGNVPLGSPGHGKKMYDDLPLRHHIAMGDETWKGSEYR